MQMQNQTSLRAHLAPCTTRTPASAPPSQRAARRVLTRAETEDKSSTTQTEEKPPTPAEPKRRATVAEITGQAPPTPQSPPEAGSSTNGATGLGASSSPLEQLNNAAQRDLPEGEAAAIAAAYKWLVQHPEAGDIRQMSFPQVEALYKAYQTILWRPAELLNGRMAMLGFFFGAAGTLINKQTVWEQVYRNPFAYLLAFAAVAGGQVLHRRFGAPDEGITVGPVKFSKTAELINARAAMVGYVILAYTQYNQEMQKAAFYAIQQIQRSGGGSI